MKIERSAFNRIYTKLRYGQAQLYPFLGLSNFVLLAYNLTTIQDFLTFETFVPLFLVIFFLALIIIGHIFNKKQQSMDNRLIFEQNKDQLEFNLTILKAIKNIDGVEKQEIEKQIQKHRELLLK